MEWGWAWMSAGPLVLYILATWLQRRERERRQQRAREEWIRRYNEQWRRRWRGEQW